jgi:putative tryptophan/tyrosine transport system substrate-binding protein
MNRRAFIAGLGGAAAWPVVARGQQPEPMRRIGVLMNTPADSTEGHARVATFRQAMQQLGWVDGGNVRVDPFWGANDVDLTRRYVADLITLAPDILLASGTVSSVALAHATRLIPIVFVQVSDPVGAGLVDALPHPGRNITGFMNFEYSLSGKWLELLRQIAPHLMRAVVIRNPDNPAGIAQFGAIQALAQSLGLDVRPVNNRDKPDSRRALARHHRRSNHCGRHPRSARA